MKKIVFALALGCGVSLGSFAQSDDYVGDVDTDKLVSKKGVPILPESEDIGLTINGTPFINAITGIFGDSNARFNPNNQLFGFVNGRQTIRVKYFTDANTAYRVGVNIGYTSNTYNSNIAQAGAPAETVEDKLTRTTSRIELLGGIEMRRGKGRLQGYYGGQARIGLGDGEKEKYTYGNDYSQADNNDLGDATLQTDFSTIDPQGEINLVGTSRTTESKTSGGFRIGADAFIGVEYFFAPKISIGGEFTWGITYDTGGKVTTTTEQENAAANGVDETETETPGNSSFTLGTGNLQGDVLVNFYF